MEKRWIGIVWVLRLARWLVHRLLVRLVEGLAQWLVHSLAEGEGHRRSLGLVEGNWGNKEVVNRRL